MSQLKYKKSLLLAAALVAASGPAWGQTAASWLSPVGGTWTDGSKWSTNPNYPNDGMPSGFTYDATIAATGTAYGVGLSSDLTVQSFTLNSGDATFTQSGGEFDAGAVTLGAGTYNATGGMLAASSVSGAAGINVAGNFTLYVDGTTSVPVSVGNGSSLTLDGNWSNAGTVTVNGGTLTVAGTPASFGTIGLTNSTLNIATYVTSGQVQSVGLTNSGVSVGLGGAVDNTGNTIALSPSGPTWTLAGGVIGAGTISSSGGAKLLLAPGTTSALSAVTLAAGVDVPAGTTLMLSSMASTSGTVTVNPGGTVTLTGLNVTTALSGIHNNGGVVSITGVISNSGNTLALDATTGPWQLSPTGTIGNGTITGTAPNALTALGGTLTGVVLDGDVLVGDATATNVSLTASTVSFASRGRLLFQAPAGASSVGVLVSGIQPTLSGPGVLEFDGSGDGGYVKSASSGVTMTFGPALTVQTGLRGGTVGAAGSSLLNQGLLSARTSGRTLTVQGTFNNQGTVEARNGGTLALALSPANLSGGTLTGGTWGVYDNATLSFPGGSNVSTNAATVTLSGSGSTFAAMNSLASNTGTLKLDAGKKLTTAGNLSNSGTVTVGPSSTLKVVGALTNTGKVDLAGGTLVLDYTGASPAETMLRPQLAAGRAAGSWTGSTGITSSTAAADGQLREAIGYAEASALGVSTWAGVGVDTTAVVTKLTWYGDANLDGKVNADDYALIDRGFARHLTGWVNGDFDYSGTIDSADYLLIDRVEIQQSGVLSPALLAEREAEFGPSYAAQLLVVTPEPSSVMIVGLVGTGVLSRRRNRR